MLQQVQVDLPVQLDLAVLVVLAEVGVAMQVENLAETVSAKAYHHQQQQVLEVLELMLLELLSEH